MLLIGNLRRWSVPCTHRRMPRSVFTRWLLAMTLIGLISAYSGIAAAADLPPGGTFTDDNGSVHEPYIEALFAAGISNGCGPELFCPGQSVTRAELAAFILRAGGDPAENRIYAGYFTDVTAGAWYTPYVERAYELGIMAGYDDATFEPLEPVSRAVFAEVLLSILGEETNSEPGDSYFSDVPPDIRLRPYIDRLYELGITRGCRSAPLMYCPGEPITRAELASFLGRGFNLAPILPPTVTTTTEPTTTTTDCPPG